MVATLWSRIRIGVSFGTKLTAQDGNRDLEGRVSTMTSGQVSGVLKRVCNAMARSPRDIKRIYSTPEVVAKLRRGADALEKDESFRIQIAGVRIRVGRPGQADHDAGGDKQAQHRPAGVL